MRSDSFIHGGGVERITILNGPDEITALVYVRRRRNGTLSSVFFESRMCSSGWFSWHGVDLGKTFKFLPHQPVRYLSIDVLGFLHAMLRLLSNRIEIPISVHLRRILMNKYRSISG